MGGCWFEYGGDVAFYVAYFRNTGRKNDMSGGPHEWQELNGLGCGKGIMKSVVG